MIKAFSKACGKEIKYEIVARRPGDIASCYAGTVNWISGQSRLTLGGTTAQPYSSPCTFLFSLFPDASLAKKELGWEATRGIEEACEDSWRWQSNNPTGFKTTA